MGIITIAHCTNLTNIHLFGIPECTRYVAIRPNNGKICTVVKIHVSADEKRLPNSSPTYSVLATNAPTVCKEILT